MHNKWNVFESSRNHSSSSPDPWKSCLPWNQSWFQKGWGLLREERRGGNKWANLLFLESLVSAQALPWGCLIYAPRPASFCLQKKHFWNNWWGREQETMWDNMSGFTFCIEKCSPNYRHLSTTLMFILVISVCSLHNCFHNVIFNWLALLFTQIILLARNLISLW